MKRMVVQPIHTLPFFFSYLDRRLYEQNNFEKEFKCMSVRYVYKVYAAFTVCKAKFVVQEDWNSCSQFESATKSLEILKKNIRNWASVWKKNTLRKGNDWFQFLSFARFPGRKSSNYFSVVQLTKVRKSNYVSRSRDNNPS